jgi:hypothetical protein
MFPLSFSCSLCFSPCLMFLFKVWNNLSHIGKKKNRKKEKEKGIMLGGGQPGRISERRHLLKMASSFSYSESKYASCWQDRTRHFNEGKPFLFFVLFFFF